MSTLWIKICGLATEEDVFHCAELGASAIGALVVSEGHANPHADQLSAEQASTLFQRVPASLRKVLLTKTQSISELKFLVGACKPDFIQIQSDISHSAVATMLAKGEGPSFIRKIAIRPGANPADMVEEVSAAVSYGIYAAILLDTAREKHGRGGTGEVHDWSVSAALVKSFPNVRFILAGGLNHQNVADAIRTVNPWGVDVMSGVSRARGVKDIDKLREFITAATFGRINLSAKSESHRK